jgi:hypothetical protein
MRLEDVRIVRVEHGRLDRITEDRCGVMNEIGVQRVVAGNQHG